jgi:hypothetical protein
LPFNVHNNRRNKDASGIISAFLRFSYIDDYLDFRIFIDKYFAALLFVKYLYLHAAVVKKLLKK